MATTRKRNVEIDVVVDDKAAQAKLKNLGATAGTTGGKFSSLQNHTKLLQGAFGVLAGSQVVNFLGDAAENAIADEAAQRQLALALKNTVGATDEQIASTEEWIDRTQRQTGIVDDQLRPALAELVRATGSLEKAQSDLGVAMDIATAKGLPLETVVKAMGKAANGNVGALGRLGLTVRDASGSFLEYNQILSEATELMGGATAAAADATEGKLKRAQIAWDELKETIGTEVVGALIRVGQDLGIVEEDWEVAARSMREEMDKNRHPIKKVTGEVDNQAAAFEELEEAIQGAADEQRAALDPAFAVLKAQRDLAKATRDYNDAVAEHGAKSMEAVDAMGNLIDAQIDAKAAAEIMKAKGLDPATDALGDAAREAGILAETIDAAAQAMRNAGKVKAPPWYGRVVREDAIHGARASGGPVSAGGTYLVGEKGPELLQMGSQGGNIVPNHALGSGGGSSYTINVNAGIGADKAAIGQAVVSAIKAYEKRNGTGWRT